MWKEFTGANGNSGGRAGPAPKHEYMGCEVNLLSANKNQEGKGAGGMPPSGGGDAAWLGGMPGMSSFAPIFKAQTENQTDGEAKSETKTESESKSENSAETTSDSSNEVEAKTDSDKATDA